MDIRLDEGFLFGMGVFETIAVEQGRPLLLEQHLNRMQGSADFLKLGCRTWTYKRKNRRISEYTGNVGEDAWST